MKKNGRSGLIYHLCFFYSRFFVWHWFSKVQVNGKEHIKDNQSYLLLPCHQNGLLDCVTTLTICKKPLTFFAKSSLFKPKLLALALRIFRVMPAYRGKEGLKNVSKNEANFQKGVDLLLNNYPLCIMPEGGQEEEHTLHPLAKGPLRIAFHAQEKSQKPIYLLPIGLDYTSYDDVGYPFVLNIGQPLSILPYIDAYQKNPPQALNTVKEELAKRLRQNMLDIQSKIYYHTILISTYLYNKTVRDFLQIGNTPSDILRAKKIIAEKLDKESVENPEKLKTLHLACQKWMQCLPNIPLLTEAKNNTSTKYWLIAKLFLLLPLFIYGISLNFVALLLVFYLTPKLKNTGFIATAKYTIFLTVSPLQHLLTALCIGLTSHFWSIAFLVFITGMPLTILTKKYWEKSRLLYAKFQLSTHGQSMDLIQQELSHIIDLRKI